MVRQRAARKVQPRETPETLLAQLAHHQMDTHTAGQNGKEEDILAWLLLGRMLRIIIYFFFFLFLCRHVKEDCFYVLFGFSVGQNSNNGHGYIIYFIYLSIYFFIYFIDLFSLVG